MSPGLVSVSANSRSAAAIHRSDAQTVGGAILRRALPTILTKASPPSFPRRLSSRLSATMAGTADEIPTMRILGIEKRAIKVPVYLLPVDRDHREFALVAIHQQLYLRHILRRV